MLREGGSKWKNEGREGGKRERTRDMGRREREKRGHGGRNKKGKMKAEELKEEKEVK